MIESVVRSERKKNGIFYSIRYLVLYASIIPSLLLVQESNDALQGLSLADILNIDVITVSKKEQKSSDAPAMIYVVTENNIKNRGYRNLQDLLEDIPEIEIQKKSTSEFSNYFTFRGISGNEKFVILLDGVRINSTTGTPHVVGANYALVNAKQVEVILGPASALYGVDAFSGIVNIITRTGDEVDGGNIAASYGQFNTTNNSFVYGKKISPKASFVVSGNIYRTDEPMLPNYYKEDFSWYHNQYKTQGMVRLAPFSPDVIFPVGIKEYATPTNAYFINAGLNFSGFQFSYSRNFESHNTSVGGLPDFNIYTEDATYKITLQSMHAKHTFVNPENKWGLQSSLSYGSYELNPKSKFVNTFSGYRDAFKYATSKSTKLEEQFNYNFSENHFLIAGFSYEDISALPKSGDLPFEFDVNQAADVQDIYYIGTNFYDRDSTDLKILQDFFYLEYKNIGSYLQYQGKVIKALEVTVGGRFDHNTRYGSSFNPRVGLVLSPFEKTIMKWLYGEAFLAPSPYKAYQHYGAFITVNENEDFTENESEITGLFGPFWHLPNPDLKPEKLKSYELSVSHYLTDNIVLSGNGYYTKISDLIVVQGLPNQEFKGIPVGFAETPVNSGLSTCLGGTVKIDALLKIGKVTMNSYAAYSYSDGKIEDDSGNLLRDSIPFNAKHTVKAGFELTYKNLSVSPRLISRSRSYHPILKNGTGDYMSNNAYTVVNLFARYDNIFSVDKMKAALFVRIENLTDKRYYNISIEGGSFFPLTPQDPLRLTAGVDIDF